jgi:hypothetical protein
MRSRGGAVGRQPAVWGAFEVEIFTVWVHREFLSKERRIARNLFSDSGLHC